MRAVSLDIFRRLLDVTKSFNIGQLNRRVLKPIEDELGDLMHLKIERKYQKKKAGSGRPSLSGFVFHFNREDKESAPEQNPTKQLAAEVEPSKVMEESRRRLEEEQARHSGSMFIGSKKYKQTDSGTTAENVPLF